MHRDAKLLAALILVMSGGAIAQTCDKIDLAQPDGPGVRQDKNCNREEGTFFEGRLWGKAKVTGYRGMTSEGEFQWGRLNGYGVVRKPATDGRYNEHRGFFYQGDPYGPGTYRYQDGVVASGMFQGGNLTGFGVLTYPNGVKMMGQFRSDEGVGDMLVVYPDGTKQTGTFSKLRYSLLRAGNTAPKGK